MSRADRAGQLERSTVLELAAAVLRRELSSVRQPLTSFPSLAPCAHDLSGVLREVAAGSAEPAAFAALTLLDAGLDAPDPDGAGEPTASIVQARRALGPSAGARRRTLMLHGDADVRRAALEAAAHSGDPADARPLLEVARLDPDPSNRGAALRALGALGGAEVVVGLADLWAMAETEQRLQIIEAWAAPPSFGSGGRAQLLRAAELESGVVAVAAALELMRRDAGAEAEGVATTLLGGALRGSDISARLLALYEVPWSNPALQPLVLEAQSSPDAAARWVSLFRQVEQGKAAEPARQALRTLASEQGATLGLLARMTLAGAGEAGVKAALRADLKAPRGRDRMLAALALAELNDWGAVAQALADDSPSVRQTVACQLLAEPRSEAPAQQLRSELFGPLAPELTRQLLTPASASPRPRG